MKTIPSALPMLAALGLSAALAAAISTARAVAPAAAAPAVAVSPLSGTLDASPWTQISFLGAPAADIRDVSVVGSQTHTHTGRLAAYSTGTGASFLPAHAFAEGELVTVRARIVSGKSARSVFSQFRVAYQVDVSSYAHVSSTPKHASTQARPSAAASPPATMSFQSRPDLHPASVTVTTASPQASRGDVFITPSGPSQSGPMIFDDASQLVWFKPMPHGTIATDLQVQSYYGNPVLTWWQGNVLSLGFGQGQDEIYDASYRHIGTVHAGNGYRADLHEFKITPQGTALLTIFDPVRESLASVHGAGNGVVTDGVIEEVDIKTGLVMWEWHSYHHVALTESYAEPRANTPLDYFHVNSIEPMPEGNLLVSARNTWAVYDISRTTGAVLWRFGGKQSSFKMGSGTGIAYQHDARLQSDGTITIFDDGAWPRVHSQSRAVQIRIDYQHNTATLVRRYEHPYPLTSGSQGNVQSLPGGGLFVGWGEEPFFSEFDSQGNLIFDAHIHAPADSYRAYRFAWEGRPTEAPAIAAVAGSGTSETVYASWNGATDVASWQVLGGASASTLAPLASAARSGFETSIALGSRPPLLAVRALVATGAVLGTSATVKS